MKEEVADYAIRDAMILLNQKNVEEWLAVDWERWAEFVVITKKTKSDAMNIISSPFENFFHQLERYYDVTFPDEEKQRLYHKPSTFNKRNYRMGSPQHSNFVEPGLDASVGYVHILHLLLYEGFEKVELQRKGIVGLIKRCNALEDAMAQYKGIERQSLGRIADEPSPPEEFDEPEPELVAEDEGSVPEAVKDRSDEIMALKARIRLKNRQIKKLKEKGK